jgi:hypothetical protein
LSATRTFGFTNAIAKGINAIPCKILFQIFDLAITTYDLDKSVKFALIAGTQFWYYIEYY